MTRGLSDKVELVTDNQVPKTNGTETPKQADENKSKEITR